MTVCAEATPIGVIAKAKRTTVGDRIFPNNDCDLSCMDVRELLCFIGFAFLPNSSSAQRNSRTEYEVLRPGCEHALEAVNVEEKGEGRTHRAPEAA